MGAVVADIDPKKREAALAGGALGAIDAGAADAVKQAQAAAKAPIGAAIDFVGAGPTARLGIDAITRGGKYVIVGLFGGDITLSLPLLPIRAIAIEGSFVGSLAEFRELLALVADRQGAAGAAGASGRSRRPRRRCAISRPAASSAARCSSLEPGPAGVTDCVGGASAAVPILAASSRARQS